MDKKISLDMVKSMRFNKLMVQALLDDRKTQTRRVGECKYNVGDIVWVQEDWRTYAAHDNKSPEKIWPRDWVQYEATPETAIDGDKRIGKLRAAKEMPLWASRVTLLVTSVRCEMLRNISERDMIAEGLINRCDHTFPKWTAGDGFPEHFEFAIGAFKDLWHSIYPTGENSWDENPIVYAIGFMVIEQNIETFILENLK